MAAIPYIHKVPVEIWREILQSAVGPSLSDPERDTLRAYEALFIFYPSLAELYITKERIRHKLMLVCRHWKDIVEDMDDKIVIGGIDEFDWPPNKWRNEAKYLHYLCPRANSSVLQDPVSRSRMRRQREAGVTPYSRGWHEAPELVIRVETPPAPVMLVTRMTVKLERELPTTFNGRVRVFKWSMADRNADVEFLHGPLFDNLTYLALTVYRLDFPPALVQPQWTFPTLRALAIHYIDDDTDRGDAFGRWHCPKLTMLKYSAAKTYHPIPHGMLTFINNHAHRLEELDLWGSSKSHWEVEENWKRLVTLKSYKFLTLEQLVEALPFMQGLWRGVDGASASRRLRIELDWIFGSHPESILRARTAQDKDLLAKLDLCLSLSWLGISSRMTFRQENRGKVVDFLAIINGLELNVFDVDGQSLDSPEGQKLREALSVSTNS